MASGLYEERPFCHPTRYRPGPTDEPLLIGSIIIGPTGEALFPRRVVEL